MRMVKDIKPHEGETERQFSWRLYSYVQSGDMTWQELADIINKEFRNGEDDYRAECTYRKPIQAAAAYYDEVFSQSDNSCYEQMQEIKNEIAKERYKLQALKLEQNRENRINSRFELFYDSISKTIGKLDPPEIKPREIPKSGKQWVLGIGDLHYGAEFKSVNNSYSRDECQRRFEVLISNLIPFIQSNNVRSLIIVNVADTIQGILRLSDLQINDVPVVRCVVEISQLIAEFLNKLSAYCSVEYYHVPSANHSQTRNLGSKASELACEDMEYIIVNYIHDMLRENRQVFVAKPSGGDILEFNIAGFSCFAMHGHQVKSAANIIKDMNNLRGMNYSYAFLGHTHSANEIVVGERGTYNIEVLTVPAFIGSDPYADSLMVGGKAMAKLYEFDELYGHVGSKNIILN